MQGAATAFVFGGLGYGIGNKVGGWIAKSAELGRFGTLATKGFYAGSFASGFSTGALIYSGQLKGDGQDISNAFLYGGVAGAVTGSINYLFYTNVHPPLVLATEGSVFFYLNFGQAPQDDGVEDE